MLIIWMCVKLIALNLCQLQVQGLDNEEINQKFNIPTTRHTWKTLVALMNIMSWWIDNFWCMGKLMACLQHSRQTTFDMNSHKVES